MVGLDCPNDADLLAWLQDPPESEQHSLRTAHIDACASCQKRLEQLDEVEERRTAAADGDGLLADLRRRPPVDELEAEPECARAVALAETAVTAAFGSGDVSRQPDAADVEALSHRGHYEVLGVLGQGGMGVVYKARNRKMNRLVAIKVLPPLKPQAPSAVARFEREMKAVARLTHPHIVAAYDADEAGGKHFLVLEYIDGVDLKSLVKAQGPLSVARAVAYLVQAARGLHYAHEQGIIHRDVKPANLMLDQSGTVKVLDLGLAASVFESGTQADLTETGMFLGTADYLAPEQAANARDIDRRADVYSLGCSLYYLLTGRPPYDGGTVIQKVLAHREQPIPSLGDACPECPASLQQVFAKMLAKRPDERYRTMADVSHDLAKVLAFLESSTLLGAAAPPQSAALAKGRTGWRPGHGKRRTLGVAVLLLVGIGAALLLLNRLHTPDGADDPLGKIDAVPVSK
jgi:serine/threonine protein kinase